MKMVDVAHIVIGKKPATSQEIKKAITPELKEDAMEPILSGGHFAMYPQLGAMRVGESVFDPNITRSSMSVRLSAIKRKTGREFAIRLISKEFAIKHNIRSCMKNGGVGIWRIK